MSDRKFNLTPQQARAKWVEALRSGEYEQGQTRLCNDGKYCCLGVLCEVYRQHEEGLAVEEEQDAKGTFRRYDGRLTSLPPLVGGWLGMSDVCGGYYIDDCPWSLAALNDTGDSFAEIADVIESEPRGLFVD